MIATVLIALAATIPAALLAFLAVWIIERAGAGLSLRLRLWSAAMVFPVATLAVVIVADLADAPKVPVIVVDAPVSAAPAESPLQDYALAIVEAREAIGGERADTPLGLVLLAAYAAGVVVCGGLALLRAAELRRLVARSRPLESGLSSRLGLSPDQMRRSAVRTPLAAGSRRPVILIPDALAEALTDRQLELICRHEIAHIAHGHPAAGFRHALLAALLWFNPAFSANRRRYLAAAEELADRDALAGAAVADRRLYAETLIEAFRHSGRAAYALAFTGAAAKRRLAAILRPCDKSRRLALIAAPPVLLGAVAATGVTALAMAAEPMIRTLPSTGLAETVERVEAAVTGDAPAALVAPVAPAFMTPDPASPQAQAPIGPIDYARPSTADREPPLMFNCILTAEGRTVGCALAEAYDGPRAPVARALSQMAARTWPMEIAIRTGSNPTMGFYETPGAVWSVDMPLGKMVRQPGSVSVFAYADGRLVLSAKTIRYIPARPMTEDESVAAREARLKAEAARNAEIEIMRRAEGRARQSILDRNIPKPLKDVSGKLVGQLNGPNQRGFRLDGPVILTLEGKAVGRLESDANGRLWFEGRQTVDRGTPLPVLDKDGVLRARRDLASLQPGDQSLLAFAPIMPQQAALP